MRRRRVQKGRGAPERSAAQLWPQKGGAHLPGGLAGIRSISRASRAAVSSGRVGGRDGETARHARHYCILHGSPDYRVFGPAVLRHGRRGLLKPGAGCRVPVQDIALNSRIFGCRIPEEPACAERRQAPGVRGAGRNPRPVPSVTSRHRAGAARGRRAPQAPLAPAVLAASIPRFWQEWPAASAPTGPCPPRHAPGAAGQAPGGIAVAEIRPTARRVRHHPTPGAAPALREALPKPTWAPSGTRPGCISRLACQGTAPVLPRGAASRARTPKR